MLHDNQVNVESKEVFRRCSAEFATPAATRLHPVRVVQRLYLTSKLITTSARSTHINIYKALAQKASTFKNRSFKMTTFWL
jgi:hypothetical protein